MTGDEFSTKPDRSDPLQVAGDAALDAIREALAPEGIDRESYSAVVCLEHGDALATVVHLPGEPDESQYARVAFETQLVHIQATARALGFRVGILPVRRG